MEIVGLGTIAMDVVVQVDALPAEDGFCVIKNKAYVPGGSGTNVIVQSARLGAQTGYIAQVGDDRYGSDILASLQQEGVNTTAMLIKRNGTSLNTEIVVADNGAKFILLDMGDCFLNLESFQVDLEYIKKAQVFYTDLIPGKPAITALQTAKQHNLKTGFNMQVDLHSMNNFSISKEEILTSLQHIDLFAPCRAGLFQLCDSENLDQCHSYIRNFFDGTLLVTLGSEGSVAYREDGSKHFEPICEIEVVDTTGAGDSYMGSMLYFYLLKGESLEQAMHYSTRCSAITCSRLGARSGPTYTELQQLLTL